MVTMVVILASDRDNGMRGLFRGLPASLMGIVPYSGTDLAMFYTLKARWMAANPDAKVFSQIFSRKCAGLCL